MFTDRSLNYSEVNKRSSKDCNFQLNLITMNINFTDLSLKVIKLRRNIILPEGGEFGRAKKPQHALEAKEWRWVWAGPMDRASPSPNKTRALLGLSAICLNES